MRGRRPSSRREGRGQIEHALHRRVLHAGLPLVDAGDRPDLGAMAAEGLLQRHGDLADGRLGPRRLDRQLEQVALARPPALVRARERLLDRLRIALGLQPRELVDLLGAHRGVVDFEHVDRPLPPAA